MRNALATIDTELNIKPRSGIREVILKEGGW
jgi:hypothetical protein